MAEPRQQESLPFGAAEGTRAERRALIEMVLDRLESKRQLDAPLRDLLRACCEMASAEEPLIKRLPELEGWRFLFCKRSKVYGTIARARELGLLAVEPFQRADLGSGYSRYWIDWAGVQAFLRGTPRPYNSPRGGRGGPPDGPGGPPRGRIDNHSSSFLEEEIPPPPSPSPGWRAVEEALRNVGVVDALGTLAAARTRELTPEAVLELTSYYRDNAASFNGPGALCFRIQRVAAGVPADQGWPPAAVTFRAAELARVREAEAARSRAADAAYAAQVAAEDPSQRSATLTEFRARLRKPLPKRPGGPARIDESPGGAN